MKIDGNDSPQSTMKMTNEDGQVLLTPQGGLTLRQQLIIQFYSCRITGLTFTGKEYMSSQVARLACEDADAVINKLNEGE